MKKVVLTLFTLAALASCTTTEIIDGGSSNNNAIAFGRVETRAGLSDLQANGFGVWAVINNTLQSNYLLMDNQKVEFTDGEWGYSPTQYWVDNTVYSFVAVWPYGDNAYTLEADKTVKLTVSETPADTDYLVATNTTNTSIEGYETTVQLNFQHILTSVGVKIWRDGAKHQNDKIRVRKVTLSNIKKAGTLTCNTDSWEYTGETLTAEVTNDTVSDTDDIGAAVKKDNGTLETGGTPSDPFGTMMLVPQTLDDTNKVLLKVTYDLFRQGASKWEEGIELEAYLPNITWEAGRQYIYNVVLSSVTDITMYYILTTVDLWGTPQVGATVIIK